MNSQTDALRVSMTELSDANLELRETYAQFGATMLSVSNLENQLSMTLLVGDFLIGLRAKVPNSGKKILSKQYQAELSAYKKELFTLSLSQIQRRVEALPVFDF